MFYSFFALAPGAQTQPKTQINLRVFAPARVFFFPGLKILRPVSNLGSAFGTSFWKVFFEKRNQFLEGFFLKAGPLFGPLFLVQSFVTYSTVCNKRLPHFWNQFLDTFFPKAEPVFGRFFCGFGTGFGTGFLRPLFRKGFHFFQLFFGAFETRSRLG